MNKKIDIKTYQVDSRALAARVVMACARHAGRVEARGKGRSPAEKRHINRLRALAVVLNNK